MSERIEPTTDPNELSEIWQAGMGFGLSNYELAGEVARNGELGIVSIVGSGMLLARRLQDGHLESKAVLETLFPDQDMAQKIIEEFYIEGGKAPDVEYKRVAMLRHKPNRLAEELNLVGAWAEVTMAKIRSEGNGYIGVNHLTKLEEPTLSALYGSMLAGANAIVMGAGIPKYIPKVINDLSQQREAALPLTVTGATMQYEMKLNPEERFKTLSQQEIARPPFFAIVSLDVLARGLVRPANPVHPDGFVIEHHSAGGHNAPPFRTEDFNERGEPIYYDEGRDKVDLEKISKIGKPFWLAGSSGHPGGLEEAKAKGANGIQVGSAFVLTKESGLSEVLKRHLLQRIKKGEEIDIITDAKASPTGFPFKVANIDGTISETDVYKERVRICDLGYLREKYEHKPGVINYRCSAEPIDEYVAKDGTEEATDGVKCICNSLAATIDFPQVRDWETDPGPEKPIVTLGNDINRVGPILLDYLRDEEEFFLAKDVLSMLRGVSPSEVVADR